jgi:glycosyltransferase involved in cell wall biosynthesis
MKLLHIVDTIDLKKGGVSQAIRTMASQLTMLGIINEVLTLDTPGDSVASVYNIHSIGPSKGPWSYSEALIPWLIGNFNRFDTIIVHGLWLYQGFAVRKALSRYRELSSGQHSAQKAPDLYIMPHGMLDPYFQRSKGRKIKAVRNWIYWKLIESRLVNTAEGILFTCRQECILANQPFSPYCPKRELIVGLGVEEPPEFTSGMMSSFYNMCPEVKNEKYILFLGRLDAKKGIELLLRAYEKLLVDRISLEVRKAVVSVGTERHEDQNQGSQYPKLVVAGPGLSTAYGKMLKKLVDTSPFLKSSVLFPGMLEADEKWGAFYGCEAFILPSHQENFGIAVVEALACGKPVLISKQVNINAEISDEHAGIVAEDTAAGTYQALKRWVSMPSKERLRMQEQAKICYSKHFATGAAAGRLLNAISYQNKQK